MRRLWVIAILFTVGCAAPAAQPDRSASASETTTPTSAPPSPKSSAAAPSAAATVQGTEFDWAERGGRIDTYSLPSDPRGQWGVLAPISAGQVLVTNIPLIRPSDEERLRYVSDLSRLDVRSGAIQPLVRLAPGMQVYGPTVAGGSIAWVETSAVDLRAYDWRLHLTDTANGADRVVASDAGVRASGVSGSVVPVLDYDGSTLVYTRLAARGEGPVWELRRLSGGVEETIAEVGGVATRRITSITLHEKMILWVESVLEPSPHAVIGQFDLAAKTVRRTTTTLDHVYQIAIRGDAMFLATGRGVLETDTNITRQLVPMTPDSATVDQMAIVDDYLIYRSFDREETVTAIDLRSRSRAVLAKGVTAGPNDGNKVVLWVHRSGGTNPGSFAIARL